MDSSHDSILNEYDKNRGLYEDLASKAAILLEDLFAARDIRVHTITHRVKSRERLQQKIERPDARYHEMKEVTDIAGVRIITYFQDEVDTISEIIETEFEIDKANSVDEREALGPDQFGYMSVHYVVKLSKSRLAFGEYKRFNECEMEIQIRTILQHAWAEIEHDLGCKSKEAIPRDVRRHFPRLAGLLESADNNFVSIRDRLNAYSESVTQQLENNAEMILIDQDSIRAFLISGALDRFDRIITQNPQAIAGKPIPEETLVTLLLRSRFESIKSIQEWVSINGEMFARFLPASDWIAKEPKRVFPRGLCLFGLTEMAAILRARDMGQPLEEGLREVLPGLSEKEIGRKLKAFETLGLTPDTS